MLAGGHDTLDTCQTAGMDATTSKGVKDEYHDMYAKSWVLIVISVDSDGDQKLFPTDHAMDITCSATSLLLFPFPDCNSCKCHLQQLL